MKTEGIILSKSYYQERHLICRVLLKSGEKVSLIFYGGRGGGKNKKGTLIELGHCLKLEIKTTNTKKNVEIYSVKEWEKRWIPKNIRNRSQAFMSLCFFLEVIDKISISSAMESTDSKLNEEGLYIVLSNSLFRLERKCLESDFNIDENIIIFLGKLMNHQGVFPELNQCYLCERSFSSIDQKYFFVEHGGFVCESCRGEQVNSQTQLWNSMLLIKNNPYQDIKLNQATKQTLQTLWDYSLYHLQMNKGEVKSASMVL